MNNLRKLIVSAMFLALGIVLPFLTGQIQQIGNMLLPMHIPVLLCGFICGRRYGLAVGLILPILRSLMFAMPPMYPMAVSMSFELAAYGFLSGYLYYGSREKGLKDIYISLISAMVFGRIVWGITQVLMLGIGKFTLGAFIAGALLNSIPGIIIQLIFVPAVVTALKRINIICLKD